MFSTLLDFGSREAYICHKNPIEIWHKTQGKKPR